MCEQVQCGIVDDTHTDPQSLPPWKRIPAIRDAALKLQMLQVKQGVLFNDLCEDHPDHDGTHSPETVRNIMRAENSMHLNNVEMQLIRDKLRFLIGDFCDCSAISIEADDQTLVLCDKDGVLWVRILVSLDDYIEQLGGEEQ